MQSHLTSSQRTVLRRIWTPPPTGFMKTAAIRSDVTADEGVIPKKMTRMGVINAPPPIPVNPTVNPTIAPAKTMCQSMPTANLPLLEPRKCERPRRTRCKVPPRPSGLYQLRT